jgi:integrase/recombinase XerD
MTQQALTIRTERAVSTTDILADFGKFLRLHTADGDASPATIRSYYSNAGQFVASCAEHGINPATATEDDVAVYRQELVAQYKVGTVAVKLAAIRRLYEAAVWRGLRQDNPAAGLRAPKDRTARAERIKFLPLEGLRQLLDAPKDNGAPAVRDRAILALMGRQGLRVSEVAGLTIGCVDFDAETVRVTSKGRKTRTVYLTETPAGALHTWLDIENPARDLEALLIAQAGV